VLKIADDSEVDLAAFWVKVTETYWVNVLCGSKRFSQKIFDQKYNQDIVFFADQRKSNWRFEVCMLTRRIEEKRRDEKRREEKRREEKEREEKGREEKGREEKER
jgi:ABC-type uncharacterized transport system involved in gliding motility auxiliary subunit